jgi:DNA-binding NarL/FixJ family response regulator
MPVAALLLVPAFIRSPSGEAVPGGEMLKVLIVEDDSQLAATLRYLIEDHPDYRVVGIADDAAGALAAAERELPDLALVDLNLARGSTGFAAAAGLGQDNIPCLFVTSQAPSCPMPELALGCLLKPFTGNDVHRAIAMAEDVMRGRATMPSPMPENLTFYDAEQEPPAPEQTVFVPAPRPSLRQRLGRWIAGAAH